MSDTDAATHSKLSSSSASPSSLVEESSFPISSPNTSVSSSTPTTTPLPSPPFTVSTTVCHKLTKTEEKQVTSTSQTVSQPPWNLTSLDTALGEKNPLSLISEEDMIQLQSVLSTEEGKKILQQTSITEMDNTPSVSGAEQSQDVSMDDTPEPSAEIPLELDDETASQILKEGIRESYLVDFAVRFSDHAYSHHPIAASSAQDLGEGSSAITISQEMSIMHVDEEPSAVPIDEELSDSQTEEVRGSKGDSPSSQARQAIRRSTRIQDQEQREMAEKIRQENIQAEKDALSQEDEAKNDPKKYNMRTKRPQRDDGRVDYTIRRGKKKIEADPENEEDEEDDKINEEETKFDVETPPRRSARPPKKKPWLLELERERESKGEDSGRDTGKNMSRLDKELSDDESDNKNDNSPLSEDESDGTLGVGDILKTYGQSRPEGREDSERDEPASRGRGVGRGRGRGRGRGLKLVREAESASSGSERGSSRSRSGGPRRGRGSRGGRGAARGRKIQLTDVDSSGEPKVRGKRGRRSNIRGGRTNKGKPMMTGKQEESDDSEDCDDNDTKTGHRAIRADKSARSMHPDSASSESEDDKSKSIRGRKFIKTPKQRVKPLHGTQGKKMGSDEEDTDGESFDSSDDDLPLNVIQKFSLKKVSGRKGPESGKTEQSVGDSESDPESHTMTPSSNIKVTHGTKGSPADRLPILQSMYEERDETTTKMQRRVRGHREGGSDEVVISSDTEDSANSNWDSEDDPDRLWCICRKPYNNRFMICCDQCKEWYHGTCVGVTRKQGKEIASKQEKWSCPVCLKGGKKAHRIRSQGKLKESNKESGGEESQEVNMEGQKQEKENKDEVPVTMEADNEELTIAFSSEEEQPMKKKSHKVKSHGDVQSKHAKSASLPQPDGVTECVEEPMETSDKGQGDGQGHKKGHDRSDDPGEPMDQPSDGEDAWTARKKDSEKKLEAMQEKLKALKAKKEDRKTEKSHHKHSTTLDNEKDDRLKSKSKSRDYGPQSMKEQCIRTGCSNNVGSGSVYCSEDCIAKYAAESLQILQHERERNYGGRSVESATDRMVVMERRTGKIVTGPAAPTQSTLRLWLEKHPSFEVLRPEQHGSMKKKEEKRKMLPLKRDVSLHKGKKHADSLAIRDKVLDQDRERREKREKEKHEKRDKRDQERRVHDRKERERRDQERKKAERQREEQSPVSTSGPNPVRIGVRKALKDYLSNRANDVDDIMLSNSEIKRVALDIEEQLFRFYGEVSSKYKHKFKHVLVNIKDTKNKGLFRKILHGEVSARDLVRMSSEQLSSKEMAHWQEPDTQHELELLGVDESPTKGSGSPQSPLHSPTMTVSQLPRIPKKPQTPDEKKPQYDPGSDFFSGFMFDTTAQHKNHLFDVNCKICTGKTSAPEDESVPQDAIKKVKFSGTTQAQNSQTEKAKIKPIMSRKSDVKPLESAVMEVDDESVEVDSQVMAEEENVKELDQEVTDSQEKQAKLDLEKSKPSVGKHGSLPVGALIRKTAANQQTVGSTRTPSSLGHPSTKPGHQHSTCDQNPGATSSSSHPGATTGTVFPGATAAGLPPSRPVPGQQQASGSSKPMAEVDPKIPKPSSLDTTSTLDASPALKIKYRFAPTPEGLSLIWKGQLFAQDLPKFVTAAYVISGSGLGLKEDLPETISIMGRLPPENVFDYLSRLKGSHATNREICVLKFVPCLDDEKNSYIQLYNYLNGRNRCGVVGAMGRVIKDLYIVPLPAHAQVPKVLMPFDGPGLEFPRPHMLLCIIVKAKPRRHQLKDAPKDAQLARTWMYAERPAGEAGKVKGYGADQQIPDDGTLQKNLPAQPVKIINKDPRLAAAKQLASTQPVMQPVQVPPLTDVFPISSSQESSGLQSPEVSISSDEDTEFSEVNMNDPIVKQYAKVNPKKLEIQQTMPGSEAYEPPEEDHYMPYDEKTAPSNPRMSTSTSTGYSAILPTAVHPPTVSSSYAAQHTSGAAPISSQTVTLSSSTNLSHASGKTTSESQLSNILEELTKKKSTTDMTAAMLATLAASSASRSIQEQRNLLMELNKKVEEQRLILEKQREESLKRTRGSLKVSSEILPSSSFSSSTESVALNPLSSIHSNVSTDLIKHGFTHNEPAAGNEPRTTEQFPVQSSVLDSELVSVKLNLARRRLAQKQQHQGSTIQPVTSEPPEIPMPSASTLPPALQSLLGGPSLESLKQIMSTVTSHSDNQPKKSHKQQEATSPEEWDELEAALNDPGGRFKTLEKEVFKEPIGRPTDEDLDYMYEGSRFDPDAEQYMTAESSEKKVKMEKITSFKDNKCVNKIPGLEQVKEKSNEFGLEMSMSSNPASTTQVPAWLAQIKQNLIDKGHIKGEQKKDEKSKSSVEPSDSSPHTESYERKDEDGKPRSPADSRSSHDRSRDHIHRRHRHDRRRDRHIPPRRGTEEDLEEGEIRDQFSPSHGKIIVGAAGIAVHLDKIPLPSDIPLPPPIVESEKSEVSMIDVDVDHKREQSIEKKGLSPRKRSRSRERRRRSSRSKSRDRRRRSRSRSRRFRSRSRSRDRSRRYRRSRSRERRRRSRSRDRTVKRSRSKDRNTAAKRKRSLSKEPSQEKSNAKNDSYNSLEKKPKVSTDSQMSKKTIEDKTRSQVLEKSDSVESQREKTVKEEIDDKAKSDIVKPKVAEEVSKLATPALWKAVPEATNVESRCETDKSKDTDGRNLAHLDPFCGTDNPFGLAKDNWDKSIMPVKTEGKIQDVDYRQHPHGLISGTQPVQSSQPGGHSTSNITTPAISNDPKPTQLKPPPLPPGLFQGMERNIAVPQFPHLSGKNIAHISQQEPTHTQTSQMEPPQMYSAEIPNRERAFIVKPTFPNQQETKRLWPPKGGRDSPNEMIHGGNRHDHVTSGMRPDPGNEKALGDNRKDVKPLWALEFPDRGTNSPNDGLVQGRDSGKFVGRPHRGPHMNSPNEAISSEGREHEHFASRVSSAPEFQPFSKRTRSDFENKPIDNRQDHRTVHRDSESPHSVDNFPAARNKDRNYIEEENRPSFRRIQSDDRIRPNLPHFRGMSERPRGFHGAGARPPFHSGPRPPFRGTELDGSKPTVGSYDSGLSVGSQPRRPPLWQNPRESFDCEPYDGTPRDGQRLAQPFKPSLLGPGPEGQETLQQEEPDDVEMAPVPEPWTSNDEPLSQEHHFIEEKTGHYFKDVEGRNHGRLESGSRAENNKNKNPFDKLFDSARFSKYTVPNRMKNPELPVPSLLGPGPKNRLVADDVTGQKDFPSKSLLGSDADKIRGREYDREHDNRRGRGRGGRGRGHTYSEEQHGWMHNESSRGRSEGRSMRTEDSSRGSSRVEEPRRPREHISKSEGTPKNRGHGSTNKSRSIDKKDNIGVDHTVTKQTVVSKGDAKSGLKQPNEDKEMSTVSAPESTVKSQENAGKTIALKSSEASSMSSRATPKSIESVKKSTEKCTDRSSRTTKEDDQEKESSIAHINVTFTEPIKHSQSIDTKTEQMPRSANDGKLNSSMKLNGKTSVDNVGSKTTVSSAGVHTETGVVQVQPFEGKHLISTERKTSKGADTIVSPPKALESRTSAINPRDVEPNDKPISGSSNSRKIDKMKLVATTIKHKDIILAPSRNVMLDGGKSQVALSEKNSGIQATQLSTKTTGAIPVENKTNATSRNRINDNKDAKNSSQISGDKKQSEVKKPSGVIGSNRGDSGNQSASYKGSDPHFRDRLSVTGKAKRPPLLGDAPTNLPDHGVSGSLRGSSRERGSEQWRRSQNRRNEERVEERGPDQRRSDRRQPDQRWQDQGRPDQREPDQRRADPGRPDQRRTDPGRSDQRRPDQRERRDQAPHDSHPDPNWRRSNQEPQTFWHEQRVQDRPEHQPSNHSRRAGSHESCEEHLVDDGGKHMIRDQQGRKRERHKKPNDNQKRPVPPREIGWMPAVEDVESQEYEDRTWPEHNVQHAPGYDEHWHDQHQRRSDRGDNAREWEETEQEWSRSQTWPGHDHDLPQDQEHFPADRQHVWAEGEEHKMLHDVEPPWPEEYHDQMIDRPRGAPRSRPRFAPRGRVRIRVRGRGRGRGHPDSFDARFNVEQTAPENWRPAMPPGGESAGFTEGDELAVPYHSSPMKEEWNEGRPVQEPQLPPEEYCEEPVHEFPEHDPSVGEAWDESIVPPFGPRGRARGRAIVRGRGRARGRGSAPPSHLTMRGRGRPPRPPFRGRGGRW